MKNLKILFLIMCLGLGTCYAYTINDCKKFYGNSQYEKASSCYYSLLSKDKNNPNLKLGYGNSLFAQKRYNEAKRQYTEIITKSPSSGVANAAKRNLELTNNMLKTISTSRSQDSGDYLSDITYVKWSRMPLNVWIESGKYSSSAKKAFYEWQNKTKGTVSFVFVDEPQDAQITVYFKKEIAKSASGEALGVTRMSYLTNGRARFAQIDIKTTTPTGAVQTPNQASAVLLHEIGHALGIKGHSKNKYDVMYYSDDNYRNALSNRDINTIKRIYE